MNIDGSEKDGELYVGPEATKVNTLKHYSSELTNYQRQCLTHPSILMILLI